MSAVPPADEPVSGPPPAPHPLKARQFGRRLLVGAFLAALFGWLALRPQPGDDPRLLVREFEAMGTVLSVSVYRNDDQTPAAAEALLDRIAASLRDYEQRWSAWGEGALGAVNRQLAAGERASIPEALQPLLARAADLGERSGGRFDVRIGHLVELWGFHDELKFRTTPPAGTDVAAALTALRAAPPLSASAQDGYGPAPQIRLDLGAIAKGDAVDLAIAQLREAGYPNAIVTAGGNLRAAGRRGDRAWRIGIRHPRPDARHRLLATLDIDTDEAVVTSGDNERYFEFEQQRYHHLLDPHSGQPARGLQSVTLVVPGDAALADAASTALFVAGAQWPAVAQALGLDQVLVVDAQGRIEATPRLAARLQYSGGLETGVSAVP